MRCYACNVELSDAESKRKLPSGDFADLCNKCFNITFPHSEKLDVAKESQEEDQVDAVYSTLYEDR